MEEQEIIEFYLKNKNKGKYWVAKKLNLNKSYVCSLIDRKIPNSCDVDIELEKNVIECINKFPYTGTEYKIAKTLNISKHKIRQLILKTFNEKILNHFSTPKIHSRKLTDGDIHQILKGSELGIGNDLMGLKIGVDGSSIRNIRKKLLTKEEYELYHSKDRYSSPFDRGYKNDRGDSFMSSLEEQVCNFLFELGIKYSTNVQIMEQNKQYCPDIHLTESGAFIEIFGMSDVECYKERMFEKIDYYNNNNIKCLYIFGDSFYRNMDWKDKVTKFLEEIKNKKFNINIKIKCN